MSGLTVLGAFSAASAWVALAIVERIRKAHERQKYLAPALSGYRNELRSINEIIQIVKDEKELQTAAVVSEVVKVEAVAARLVDCLKTVDPETRGSTRQLARQLVQGSKDEKALADVMDELSRAKSSLTLHIQAANVGLTRTVGDTILANAKVINRMNVVLQKVFGEGRGLKLAELLKNRSAEDDGMVPLSDGDIESLSDEASSFAGDVDVSSKRAANDPTSRIVIDNFTEEQALQINGPIGEKGWWEVSHLEIKNNKAGGRSTQVNHGTSMAVFERLLLARAADLSG